MPYQRQVRQFAKALYERGLGLEVEVGFAPVDAPDDKATAEVSRMLVEAGIKTPGEVGGHYWK